MAGRNNDKINYPTNITNPSTFVVLLNAIEGVVTSSESRKNIFPNARAAVSRFNADNNDTHGEGTLKTYGLIEYVSEDRDATFKVSYLGKRLLEIFEKNDEGKFILKEDSEYTYNSILIDCLLHWNDITGKEKIYPGMLLLMLLSDNRIEEYITDYEWSYICEESDYRDTRDYEKIIADIIEFRKNGELNNLKNGYVFLVAFSASWGLLERESVGEQNRFKLNNISKENLKCNLDRIKYYVYKQDVACVSTAIQKYSPDWFKEMSEMYHGVDDEVEELLIAFYDKFSPENLEQLFGKELLNTIFLNNENAENLCRILEFDPKIKDMFGRIKGGSAYKYGLFFSTDGNWTVGTSSNPQKLSEDEAIELGTKIRNYLVAGVKTINEFGGVVTLEDYKNLYLELRNVTEGFIDKAWFMKYYFMMFPELLASDYSDAAQRTVLSALGIEQAKYDLVRMGQIKLFTDECGISNVMFNKIFWDNYVEEIMDKEDDETSIEIIYETQCDNKGFARNRILFGAPGSGKSFTLNADRKELLYGDKNIDESKIDLLQFGSYERITFHPDYSYANFVGTYKPVPYGKDSITYEYVPGPFMRVYVEALKSGCTSNPKPYLLIVEEINRANVAAVFGDIFQLLDRHKNVSEYPIMPSKEMRDYLAKEDVLGGSPDDYKYIKIPDNMFIWATMNSADQGVFPMDTAFKRRWDFIYLGIDDAVETMSETIKSKKYTLGKGSEARCVSWDDLRCYINGVLLSEEYNVNEDKLLGPYFISKSILENSNDEEFIQVFKNKVLMYLFDDAVKQKKKTFFEKCKDEIKGVRYSDICKKFDEKGVFIFPGNVIEKFTEKPNTNTEPEASAE